MTYGRVCARRISRISVTWFHADEGGHGNHSGFEDGGERQDLLWPIPDDHPDHSGGHQDGEGCVERYSSREGHAPLRGRSLGG